MSKRVVSKGNTQATGDVTLELEDHKSTYVQVSFNKSDLLVAGSLSVFAKYDQDGMWETVLTEDGSPRTVDMSNPLTFKVDGAWMHSMKIVPTGLTPNESYDIMINHGVHIMDAGKYS